MDGRKQKSKKNQRKEESNMNRRNVLTAIAALFAAPAAAAACSQADDTARRLDAMKRAYEAEIPIMPNDVYQMTGVYYKDHHMPLGSVRGWTQEVVFSDDDKAAPVGVRHTLVFESPLPIQPA